MCAASEISASECESTPATTSTAMNPRISASAAPTRRAEAGGAWNVTVCVPGVEGWPSTVPGRGGGPAILPRAAGVSASGVNATHPRAIGLSSGRRGGGAEAASPPGPSSSSVRRRPISSTTSTTTITTISTPPAM